MKKRETFFHPRQRSSDFSCGMLVRYVGETSRHDGGRRMVNGGIYTVARAVDDGTNCWVSVQEMPGERHCATRFAPTPHLAEDHWVGEHG